MPSEARGGLSKREWALAHPGQPIPSDSNSGGGSSSSMTTYKPKNYNYKDFVDTKPLEKAYSSAKSVFTDQLTALKPRYEELYKQLQAEKELAMEKEASLSAEEATQQKRNLAKRGVSVDTDNPYYTTEAGKLQKEQSVRSRETALEFGRSRLDISQAESADTRDYSTAIANLDLTKANTITNLISSAKQTAAGLNSQEAERVLQSAQWNKAFEYNKSKDEADRALDLYKLSKAETSSKDTAYKNALASLVTSAYSNTEKGDYSKPGQRENIIKELQIAFPDLSNDQIAKDVGNQMPNGWESSAWANSFVSDEGVNI